MMADDSELLRRYVETRSEAAFAELVQRYLPLVYHAAHRQLNADAHLAEDVAQAVFSRLAQKSASLVRHPTLAGWLHTTTRCVVRETRRAEHRRRAREQEAHLMNENLTSPGRCADWEQLRPVIDEALGELNDVDRETILLRFFADRPLRDIGVRLNISENTARMRVERALEKLRVLLDRRGVTSSGSALGLILANNLTAAVPAALTATITGAALASGGMATSLSLLGFMSTPKLTSAAVAAVLLAAGSAVYEVRTARAAEAQLSVDRRAVYALSAKGGEAELRAKAAEFSLVQNRAAVKPNEAAKSGITNPEDEGNGPMGPIPAGSRARGRALMEAYPEIKELVVRRVRNYFAGRFDRFYQEQGLTPAQIEGFEQIMSSGISNGYSFPVRIPGEPFLPGKSPTVSFTLDAAPFMPAAEKEERLRELLGASGYQRMIEYQESELDSRVNQLASALYFTDAPLAPEQGKKLQRVLAERYRTNRAIPPANYWMEVRKDARAFLSDSQLDALQDLQAADEFYATLPSKRLKKFSVQEKAER